MPLADTLSFIPELLPSSRVCIGVLPQRIHLMGSHGIVMLQCAGRQRAANLYALR